MSDVHIFSGVPFPPTSNKMYWAKAFRTKGGKSFSKMIPSTELIDFKRQMDQWHSANMGDLRLCELQCREWLLNGWQLRMDIMLCMPHEMMWTLKNTVKKLDADNRRKALQDSFFEYLRTDDRYVWAGDIEKVETSQKFPFCIVHIKPHRPRAILEKP